MSQTPPGNGRNDNGQNENGLAGLNEAEALAMDYALGAADRAARRAAEVRLLSDPEFAAAVTRWQALLGPLDLATTEVPPPAAVWAAIAAETTPQPVRPRAIAAPPALQAGNGWWHNLTLWRGLGIGGPVLAALAVALLMSPASSPNAVVVPGVMSAQAAGASLVATLTDGTGKPLLAAAYDPVRAEMRFAPVAQGSDAKTKVPELWVIDGKLPPRSLGVIDISAGAAHKIPLERLAGLKAGVVLAISIEPIGGSPTGAPTGPVIATGVLAAG